MKAEKNRETRIGIVGAGPAGLSAAHFLKERGYRNLTVFEKNDRVGGKCISLTVDGKSFDLGANYITANYSFVRTMAQKLKADMYTEGGVKSYFSEHHKFRSVFSAVVHESSFFAVSWQSFKYMWKRWRLNNIISEKKPGYRGIHAHSELCQPFEGWLKENGMKDLVPIFDFPITLMGYGSLSQIPAAYALTYQPVSTFIELIAASISTKILGWPKRFTEGFQRFWERLSWTFDKDVIRLNTRVTGVTRGQKIKVDFESLDTSTQSTSNASLEFDYLFIGVPLYKDALDKIGFDLTPTERKLFGKVIYDPFIITTYKIKGCEVFTAGAFVFPIPKTGQPFVINRQFPDTDYITMYTRWEYKKPIDKAAILAANADFIRKCLNLELGEPYTYNEFVYFPHVTTEDMASGFYDELEDLQGQNNTFFVGGLMNFELVEMIVDYSKHLVHEQFPEV